MHPHCLFIAIHLPDHIASILEQRQQSLRQHQTDLQNALCWTPKRQFHLTLAFLGKVERASLPSVIETLETASKVLSPQSLQLGKCGLFCRRGIPTVIWSEVQINQEFHDWRQKLCENLQLLCPNLDNKEFHPHLTLGRVKRGHSVDRSRLKQLFEHAELCSDQQTWTGEQVALMQSEHCSKGATHSILHTCNLGK